MRSIKICLLITAFSIVLMLPVLTSCASAKACLLEVSVMSVTGSPIEGARVSSVNEPEGQREFTGTTGKDGRVTFNDIKLGEYRISVEYPGYTPRAMEFTLKSGQNFLARFVISEGESAPPVIPTYESYGEGDA